MASCVEGSEFVGLGLGLRAHQSFQTSTSRQHSVYNVWNSDKEFRSNIIFEVLKAWCNRMCEFTAATEPLSEINIPFRLCWQILCSFEYITMASICIPGYFATLYNPTSSK